MRIHLTLKSRLLLGAAALALGPLVVPAIGHAATTITALASFNSSTGQLAYGGVFMDANGNLYGTTSRGGASNNGTVYEVVKGSGTITTLASFGGNNGAVPYGGLISDAGGNLYGTTAGGGPLDYGTVFELAKDSGTITTLASFNGANGVNPKAALVADASGNLYGTTQYGGAAGYGTVFALQKGSGTITTLASFTNGNGTNTQGGIINSTGVNPESPLIIDARGNLYGTAYGGGAYGYGTVFEVAQGSGTITTLASFNHSNGSTLVAGLIADASGNLYGTTANGGVGGDDGTVFELVKDSGTITTLASFNGSNGKQPWGGLYADANGNLYGTARNGGLLGQGTVFKVAQGSGTITVLANFDSYNGSGPVASLIADASGNLYGTALFGGPAGYDAGMGTVFQVTGIVNPDPRSVPAPAGLGLFGLGLAALGLVRRAARRDDPAALFED
jgi:uncharacterized repeat protein (TIGR03803 family)